MHEASAAHGNGPGRTSCAPPARVNSLSGVSSLAVCRSLCLRVLPAAAIACVLVTPENQLEALESSTSAAHLRIEIANPPRSSVRAAKFAAANRFNPSSPKGAPPTLDERPKHRPAIMPVINAAILESATAASLPNLSLIENSISAGPSALDKAQELHPSTEIAIKGEASAKGEFSNAQVQAGFPLTEFGALKVPGPAADLIEVRLAPSIVDENYSLNTEIEAELDLALEDISMELGAIEALPPQFLHDEGDANFGALPHEVKTLLETGGSNSQGNQDLETAYSPVASQEHRSGLPIGVALDALPLPSADLVPRLPTFTVELIAEADFPEAEVEFRQVTEHDPSPFNSERSGAMNTSFQAGRITEDAAAADIASDGGFGSPETDRGSFIGQSFRQNQIEFLSSPESYSFSLPRVPLAALVDALSDRFEPGELEWIRNSSAIETHIPVSELQAAGIPLGLDIRTDKLAPNLAALQQPSGQVGSGLGDATGNGKGGHFAARKSLSATVSAGFDSNPFLADFADPEAASIRFQLAPSLSRSSERNTYRLTGRIEHIEYLGQYESLQNFGADFAASHRANERLEIDGALLFRSNILATNLANPFFNDDTVPDIGAPPVGNDITVIGQGQRRDQFGADLGLSYALSEHENLRWSVTARADRFGTEGLVDSNFIATQFQYEHQVNGGLAIGAVIDASLIDFTEAGRGDAQTVTPQAQVTAEITPRLEASASVGVAITRLEFGSFDETTTALAGNVSLCNRGERANFCVNGSRQVLPAAIGGALIQTAVGASYSYRLSERDTLQLNANYGFASQPTGATFGDFETVNASARYERRLDERTRLFVSGGYLNAAGNLATDRSNFQALIGITTTFGNSR